jgi:hypothetical protein
MQASILRKLAAALTTLWLVLPWASVFGQTTDGGCCKGDKCCCADRGGCARQPSGAKLVKACGCGKHAGTPAAHGTDKAVFPAGVESPLPGPLAGIETVPTPIPDPRDLGPEPPPPRGPRPVSRVGTPATVSASHRRCWQGGPTMAYRAYSEEA